MTSFIGMFKKLSATHLMRVPAQMQAAYAFGATQSDAARAIYYTPAEEREPLEFLPPDVRCHFEGAWMTIGADHIPPHVDNEMLTAINFYIETADATTYFWRTRGAHRRKKCAGHTDGYLVHEDDVDLAAQFTAQPGEIWVLNVRAIHSVRRRGSGTRVAYQLQTRLPYERVLAILGVPDGEA